MSGHYCAIDLGIRTRLRWASKGNLPLALSGVDGSQGGCAIRARVAGVANALTVHRSR